MTILILSAPEQKTIASSSEIAPTVAGAAKTRVVHVARRHPKASDLNSGTDRRPLLTIQAAADLAMARNAHGKPTRVVIHPGIYRETIRLNPDDDSTAARISFVGTRVGKAVISGSDIARDWQPTGDAGIFKHTWTHDWGLSPLPPQWGEGYAAEHIEKNPVIRRREMVFANQRALTQVMSMTQLRNSSRGAFFVSESENLIYARFPTGVAPSEATVEIAVRHPLLSINGRRNVVLKKLVFRHAPTPLDFGAVTIRLSSRVKVARSRIVWNNVGGLRVSQSKRIRLIRNTANHNGNGGIGAFRVEDLLLRGNETSYNNWRGARGWDLDDRTRPLDANLIDWSSGQKFYGLDGARFIGHRSIGNLTGGLWFDSGNRRVLVRGSVLRGNLTHGIFLEANQGPIRIVRNAICNNETGVLISNTRRGRISNNVIRGKLLGQIFVVGSDTPRSIRDDTGGRLQVMSERWRWRGNTVMAGARQKAVDTHLRDGWQQFVSTLTSRDNTWLHARDPKMFKVPEARLDLEGWQAHSGQDLDSKSRKSGVPCRLP